MHYNPGVYQCHRSVKDNLPTYAQEIYLAAFNNACQEYKDPKKQHKSSSKEVVAHTVAWAAVKKRYVKRVNKWEEIDDDL